MPQDRIQEEAPQPFIDHKFGPAGSGMGMGLDLHTGPAQQPSRPPPPRLAESPDDLWRAIQRVAVGEVLREAGSRWVYPTLRVICGPDFSLRHGSNELHIQPPGGDWPGQLSRPATDAEAQDFHDALNQDFVQVIYLEPPGYGSNYSVRGIVKELHSPSGQGFDRQRLAARAAPNVKAMPAEQGSEQVQAHGEADRPGHAQPALASQVVPQKAYLIAHIEHSHKQSHHVSWWKPDSLGYTICIDKAGLYSEAEASAICRAGSCIAVLAQDVEPLARSTPYSRMRGGKLIQMYDGGPHRPVVNDAMAWLHLLSKRLLCSKTTDRPTPMPVSKSRAVYLDARDAEQASTNLDFEPDAGAAEDVGQQARERQAG